MTWRQQKQAVNTPSDILCRVFFKVKFGKYAWNEKRHCSWPVNSLVHNPPVSRWVAISFCKPDSWLSVHNRAELSCSITHSSILISWLIDFKLLLSIWVSYTFLFLFKILNLSSWLNTQLAHCIPQNTKSNRMCETYIGFQTKEVRGGDAHHFFLSFIYAAAPNNSWLLYLRLFDWEDVH